MARFRGGSSLTVVKAPRNRMSDAGGGSPPKASARPRAASTRTSWNGHPLSCVATTLATALVSVTILSSASTLPMAPAPSSSPMDPSSWARSRPIAPSARAVATKCPRSCSSSTAKTQGCCTQDGGGFDSVGVPRELEDPQTLPLFSDLPPTDCVSSRVGVTSVAVTTTKASARSPAAGSATVPITGKVCPASSTRRPPGPVTTTTIPVSDPFRVTRSGAPGANPS
mmetsp:Transcript_84121/g.224886  ORF Transcript_84121/g.224886 Transcript_84121/m.224886 type:complete len:226 (-) Transcript_84121:313-990(-)